MKKSFVLFLIALLVLIAIVLIRSFSGGGTAQKGQVYDFYPDEMKLAQVMSGAVKLQTISYGRDKPTSKKALLAMHDYLQAQFPRAHAVLTREVVADYSLLYHWKGQVEGKGGGDKPILMLGHMDVVPIIPGTENDWQQPPFAGNIVDGFVWGRGTLDDKINVIGLLSAVEYLLATGFTPKRDIYFAFGHDEEQGGLDGAREIAKILKARNLEFEFLVDEGGLVADGLVPGISSPVAIIAPAEKGIVTLQLTARAKGGHSSMPADNSAIGILAKAIVALEENQFPRDFSHTANFLRSISDDVPLMQRIMFKNLWLFAPLIKASMQGDNAMQAAMRTTTAVTVISGGVKSNVLPIDARAKVNFRILPGETVASVKERVERVIDDPRIQVDFEDSGQVGMDPSPVSPTQGFGWQQLEAAIRDIAAPEKIVIAPRLLVAATDTRHYREVTPNHYRFAWLRAGTEDLGRIHGTNERISIQNLADAVRFYHRLLAGL